MTYHCNDINLTPKPLLDWGLEFGLRKELGLTTADIETMDYEKYTYFGFLLEEGHKEEQRKLKEAQKK